MRLISDNGEQLGVMSTFDAQRIADDKGLDLVKISPNVVPPVCKIMDYGKYCFEQNKKEKEAKKKQHVSELKEIWLSMTIDTNDLERLAKQAAKFCKDGNKVKVSIKMRGRQIAHSSLGIGVMDKFSEMIKDSAVIEKKPLTEGRNIIMILAPQKQTSITKGE